MPQRYTRYQVIVLTIYACLSLPILPLTAIMYPFSKWITQDANAHACGEKVEYTIEEWLSLSIALSIFMYMIIRMAYCFLANTR